MGAATMVCGATAPSGFVFLLRRRLQRWSAAAPSSFLSSCGGSLQLPLHGRGSATSIQERRVDMVKDKIPQLFPHVMSLVVHISHRADPERHSFGDGVAGLLTRFNNLIYLELQQDDVSGCKKKGQDEDDRDKTSFACEHEDHWESGSMSFARLRVAADFTGLTGTDCELRFLHSVLASAKNIQTVNIGFSLNYSLEGRMDDFRQKLLAHGTWTACDDDGYRKSYTWRLSS